MGKGNPEDVAKIINDFKKEEDEMEVVFTNSDLVPYKPMTKNQEKVKDLFLNGQNLICDGVAGVGKTFSALNLAFEAVLDENSVYEKVVIVRSAVATRDIGFLPGTEEQKLEVLEKPYSGICDEIFRKDIKHIYKALKHNGYIDFMSTSYIRGITIKKSIVVVDECQNLNFHELQSVITRLDDNSKIIFCGDYNQTDLIKTSNDKTGILRFKEISNKMASMSTVTFDASDIVRGGLVAEYYHAQIELDEEDARRELVAAESRVDLIKKERDSLKKELYLLKNNKSH